ncbi:hypothetical protein KTD31_01925 [Burkholderia multivorans]|uniref:hypothetical protein n=1 Tax=Burkholderia multivorans TaxID=87883 RepID=UPI001C229E74|nr:hypothetical protein [Burkholderia multivorans]MBU9200162.1 hypothetical protein [Burkholderia multivorans]MDN8078716.1 hypothetical protein [Burkholderia multivorans]
MSVDSFRPKTEPALSIYDALSAEMAHRKGRTADVWLAAERHAVFLAAREQAEKLQLYAPNIKEIERAEMLATGHSDYAAKWAIGVANIMLAS